MNEQLLASGVEPRITESRVMYAQCWEDADVLVAGLDVRPGQTCLSVASAGDNSLALLTREPRRVIAVDVSSAQLACLELRVAAYRCLDHAGLLELMGSRESRRRRELYTACRDLLGARARQFWDGRLALIERFGLGGVGRFERYFRIFRRFVLPLVHSRAHVRELLRPKPSSDREDFYANTWDTRRWRALVHAFFSEKVMSCLGREPAFFAHAEDSLAAHVARRAHHALAELDPADNPYLAWILTGQHGDALPLSLRAVAFDVIRHNLPRLEWHRCSLEDYVQRAAAHGEQVAAFNLSDVFEYMGPARHVATLESILEIAPPGARLLYWNMLVPRARPDELADRLQPLDDLAARLYERDKAFFYSALRIEEVR